VDGARFSRGTESSDGGDGRGAGWLWWGKFSKLNKTILKKAILAFVPLPHRLLLPGYTMYLYKSS